MNFDDELKKRMELARRQGWSDEEINRSALIERGLQRQKQAQQTQQQKQGGGFGSFALNLIPGGSLIDKANRGQKIDRGDIVEEAALTLLPFGVGKIAKAGAAAFRGAKAASTTKRIARSTDIPASVVQKSQPAKTPATRSVTPSDKRNVLPEQVTQVFKPKEDTLLQRAGSKVRGYGRGVQSGTRPEGSAERLQPGDAARINKVLDTIGAKGSVPQQLERVDEVQTQVRGLITQLVTSKNKPVTPKQLEGIAQRVKTYIIGANGQGVPGFDAKVHGKLANNLQRQMNSAKDINGLENFRKSLDDVINYSRNPASPDPMAERIAQAFRREIDSVVTQIVPEAKRAKALYGILEGAKDALVVNSPMTLQQTAGTGGLFSKLFSSAATQKALSGTGRGLQTAGKVASTPAVSVPAQQAGVRLLAGTPQAASKTQVPDDMTLAFQDPQSDEEVMLNELLGQGVNDFDTLATNLYGGGDTSQQTGDVTDQGGMQYGSADLFNAAMQALQAGDTKGANQLANFAELAADFEKQSQDAQAGPKLSANQAKELQKFNAADNVVNQLEQGLAQAGLQESGPNARVTGAVRNLVGAPTGLDAQARIYKSQREGYVAALAKSLGEVGTLSDTDKKAAIQLIPNLTDSVYEAREKIRRLRELISSNKQSLLASPQSSDELPESITQAFAAPQYAH